MTHIIVEKKALQLVVDILQKTLHRSTVPASTDALLIGERLVIGAVPIIVSVYVFPFVRPIRVWLLVLPPSTSTLSLLLPPPV